MESAGAEGSGVGALPLQASTRTTPGATSLTTGRASLSALPIRSALQKPARSGGGKGECGRGRGKHGVGVSL